MFCPKCGTKAEDGALQCANCGKELTRKIAEEETTYAGSLEEKTEIAGTQISPEAGNDTVVVAPVSEPEQQTDIDATVRSENLGAQISANAFSAQAPVSQVQQMPPVPAEKPKKEKKININKSSIIKKVVALVLVAAIIVAGGIVGAHFMTQKAMQGGGFDSELALGNKYLKDMNYEKALLCYENAIDMNPESAEAQYGYARANTGLQNYEDAEKGYKQAIKLNEMYADAYNGLAELYIQQDKKEEARKVIDTAVNEKKITDAVVLEKHHGMNPEAPITNVDPQNYNSGARYAVVLGDKYGQAVYYTHEYDGANYGYGVTKPEPKVYSEPIILQNGRNIIRAYVVSSYGFKSDEAVYEYNISKTDVALTFADPTVESAVRSALGKSYGEPVYDDEAARITELSIVGSDYTDSNTTFTQTEYFIGNGSYGRSYQGNVTNLSDLRYMPFLNTLNISFQQALDFSTLMGCDYLENLSLINVNLTSVDRIASMKSLKKLCLGWNNITDISALASLTELTHLGVWGNAISNISVVSKFTKLEYLDISDNRVNDISAVSGLAELREFWAYGNGISNFAPLVGLNKLKVLMVSGNPISDMADLKKIYPRLTKVDIQII